MEQAEVKRIIDALAAWAERAGGGDPAQLGLLTRLKVLTRDKTVAGPLYTAEGIHVLVEHAYGRTATTELASSHAASLEAQRCLANALLQSDEACLLAIGIDAPDLIVRMLEMIEHVTNDGRAALDEKFLFYRVLFLLTAKQSEQARSLIEADSTMPRCIAVIENGLAAAARGTLVEAIEIMVVSELLKLLYNISAHAPALTAALCADFGLHRRLEALLANASRVGSGIVCSHIVNLMSNLPAAPFASASQTLALLDLLRTSIEPDSKRVLLESDQLAPLMTLLCRIHDVNHADTNALLRERLLVGASAREVPLGRGDGLAARLLTTANDSSSPVLKNAIMTLLFTLSDADPQQLIKNVGYGHASGFLLQHGLPVPPDALANLQGENGADPVTGQDLAAQEEMYRRTMADLGEMTEDEKEREAEKLFVLFQRLKKNGVMQVQDPIQEAVQSGRFQSMD